MSTYTNIRNSWLVWAEKTALKHRVTKVVTAHSMVLEALVMSIALGTILSVIPQDNLEGHFLQRAPQVQQTSSASSKKTLTLRERALQRRARRFVRRTTVVTQVGPVPSLIIEEPIHDAAPMISSSSVSSPETISTSSALSVAASVPQTSVDEFPAFDHATYPVGHTPNWGAMTTPQEWERAYRQMSDEDFVRLPSYDLETLTIPLESLMKTRNEESTIKMLTAKLYFSTRFFGRYDLDSGEFEAVHPGLDLKLAEGTPIGAIAGGRVHAIRRNEGDLGLHVIIEHRAPDRQTYYSIYGHLGATGLQEGQSIAVTDTVGTVGMTGNTTAPHLHLQVDRGEPNEIAHEVYWPAALPSRSEANLHCINPISFIREYAQAE